MGRGYLMLPCRHQRAALPDPYTAPGIQVRRCRTCRVSYTLEIQLPEPGGEGVTALVMRNN
jgi:hypothetical protein